MEKKYIWDGDDYGEHEFTVTRPDDCSIKITKDKYSVIISPNNSSGGYIIASSDEKGPYKQENCSVCMAVGFACKMILNRSNYDREYKKRCSELEDFYKNLPKKT